MSHENEVNGGEQHSQQPSQPVGQPNNPVGVQQEPIGNPVTPVTPPPNEQQPNAQPIAVRLVTDQNPELTPFERDSLILSRAGIKEATITRRIAFFAFAAACVAAGFVWAQWWEMNNQTMIAANALQKSVIDSNQSDIATRNQLKITGKQADAAKKAADTAAKNLELDERPWISINTILDGPLKIENDVEYLPLRLILTNIGHSPAAGIETETELYFPDPKHFDIRAERERFCREAMQVTARHMDEILFPQSPQIQLITQTTTVSELAQHGGFLNTAVTIVCTAYRPTFDEKAIYYTSEAYSVAKIGPNGRRQGIKAGEAVPLEILRLDPFIFGGAGKAQ